MDLTETFEHLFTGKHFTSDAEFEKACEDFRKSTGVRFARRHVLSRQEPLPNLPNLLLKQGQFTCSVSYCNAFFAVGSKKCGVYVTRFNMHHIHGPMPEEEYNVVCDLTNVFRQYFPVDQYSTFEEFHNLLIAFQSHTGSSYVKRHTVRWPADAIDKQHLVYARAHFECVRYGWSESNATSRPVNSKRIGCKAYVVIQTYKGYVQIFHLNMQHNHEITSDDLTGSSRSSRRLQNSQIRAPNTNVYTYSSALSEGVPQATECVPPNIIQPVKIRRIQAVSETVKLENYMLNKVQQSKMAVLDAQLQSLRNMAFAEFGIIGENGECDEMAIEMCEELQQLENSWRQYLSGSEEQRETAPILVEFASASSGADKRSDLKVDLQVV
ncbi:unnamed protein product [Rodentolepis nana]|uniref:FAR1 domain-containing protein n=1 Tax=Rodentolepis nana TaxID=102285 RepID=A0A0R3TBE7_RODNA|nr:unnamed protein product [Rodentolepis nana]